MMDTYSGTFGRKISGRRTGEITGMIATRRRSPVFGTMMPGIQGRLTRIFFAPALLSGHFFWITCPAVATEPAPVGMVSGVRNAVVVNPGEQEDSHADGFP
ncbi:MAG: hypothetical protein ABFC24_00810 [Methanoregulaceae archaeon]